MKEDRRLWHKLFAAVSLHAIAFCAFWGTVIHFGAGGYGSDFPLILFWGWPVTVSTALGGAPPVVSNVVLLSAGQMLVYSLCWVVLSERGASWKSALLIPLLHLLGGALSASSAPANDSGFLEGPLRLVFVIGAWLQTLTLFCVYWAGYVLALRRPRSA